jgi:hypothetical protein
VIEIRIIREKFFFKNEKPTQNEQLGKSGVVLGGSKRESCGP